jgi:hypothetical protein
VPHGLSHSGTKIRFARYSGSTLRDKKADFRGGDPNPIPISGNGADLGRGAILGSRITSVLPTIRELSRGWQKSKCRVLPLAVRLGDGKCQSLRGLRGFPFLVHTVDEVGRAFQGSAQTEPALTLRQT